MEKTTSKTASMKIIAAYILVGGLWILFSDVLLSFFSDNPIVLSKMQTVKGLFFVGITALLLSFLITRYFRSVQRSEDMLRESEEKYHKLLETANDAIFVADAETGTIIDANRKAGELLGMPVERIIGMHQSSLHPDEEGEKYKKIFAEHIKSGEGLSSDLFVLRGDGGRVPVEISASIIDLGGKKIVQGIFHDISDRRLKEEALRESEARYRSLVDNAPVGIYETNLKGEIFFANEALSGMLGYDSPEELKKVTSLGRYKDPRDRELLIERLKDTGRVSNFETEILTRDGRVKNVLMSATLENGMLSGMIIDITGHKKLEEQIRSSQKMDAIGKLAGGIAHDFNNMLTAIIGYSSLLKTNMDSNNPLMAHVEQILTSAEKAAGLTHQILTFSRKHVIEVRPLSLNDLVRDMEKMMLSLIGEDIELKFIPSGEDPVIMADGSRLDQVLINLAANARDAMPRGGVLTITTSIVEMDREFIVFHGYGKEGRYALLTFTDTGAGFDESTRERIFEPFYTTKETGRGTGLGLAVVYGIVEQHNAYIDVSSEPGKGTSFCIYFPVVDAAAEQFSSSVLVEPAKGSETILMAEDDIGVRRFVRTVLEGHGYEVIDAEDGADAVEKFKNFSDKIALVVLDVVMPRLNGKEAHEEIMKVRPDAKVLFMSGYTADIIQNKGIIEGKLNFISKPILPADLLTKVRELLDN